MIRVLVVDDSATMRRVIQTALQSAPDIEVHLARSGEEALEIQPGLRPDVMTMDVILPGMDGLECLARVMSARPCPIIMVSSLTARGAVDTLTALGRGAVDFLQKPVAPLSPDLEPFRSDLLKKVRIAARARMQPRNPAKGPISALKARAPIELHRGRGPAGRFPIVLIGASTGGPAALETVLPALPAGFPAAIVVAQHMPAAFTAALSARLDRKSVVPIQEVATTTPVVPGVVYIGRGDADLIFSRQRGVLTLSSIAGPPRHESRPSIDRMIETAMDTVDAGSLIGVLLTGMGTDGAAAMTELKRRGGRTIAESRETALIFGMPRALTESGGAGRVEPLHRIGPILTEFARRPLRVP